MPMYNFWGVSIASEHPWPALAPFAVTAAPVQPEVSLYLRTAACTYTVSHVVIRPRLASVQVRGIGHYVVRAGQEIVVTPDARATPNAVQLYLLGSVWGILGYQRGLLPLHASVLQVGEGAIAFCGPSGAGKSTLAAWLAQRGYAVLGDDLCRCDPQAAPSPLVWPGVRHLKLWRSALEALGQSPTALEQDLQREDKFHLPYTRPTEDAPRPLRAIYLLDWGALHVTPLMGSTALRQFVAAATYRGALLEPMERLAAHWQLCAEVVRGTPIYRLSRPRDWTSMEQVFCLLPLV